jgi:predicted nuclease of predicted toxin-antitoxin system
MAIRFHLDEHVSGAIANGLRDRGWNVTTSVQAFLLGHDDDDQLAFATREGRVFVTHDSDFARINAAGAEHSGICYCHGEKYKVGELLQMLLLVAECMTEDAMQYQFLYL